MAGDGWWTVGEALGWIAFGVPVEGADYSRLPGLGWKREAASPSPELLAALESQTRREPWKPLKSPPWPARHYRAAARRIVRDTGETPAYLAAEIRAHLERDADCAAAVERAQGALRSALAAGRLSAWGLETRDTLGPPVNHEMREIPATAFAGDYALTVSPNGWTYPPLNGQSYVGRLWQGIRVRQADTREAFRGIAPMTTAPGRPAPNPPSLCDMPAHWTLLESVVWIMLRDTAQVAAAAPEAARAQPDAAQIGMLRATIEWAARKVEGDAPLGPCPDDAEHELLARLRAGTLAARGVPAGEAERRGMTADDWRGLMLVERDRGRILSAEPERITGRVWGGVTIAQDALVKLWPPFDEPASREDERADGIRGTVAEENRMREFLAQRMREAPSEPPGKAAIRAEAEAAGVTCSDRGFQRAYMNAVADSGANAWSLPGRKSKRRIETPV